MEEDDQRSYRPGVTDPLTDAELGYAERLSELLSDPASSAPIGRFLSALAEWAKAPVPIDGEPDLVWPDGERVVIVEYKSTQRRACRRLWRAAWNLRRAKTISERRHAARQFLDELAGLRVELLKMLARVLLVLLSRLLSRTAPDDVPIWKPIPIDATPQIAPRAPNPAVPVNITWGGHCRSTLGSVVLAA
ncbi:hypothetical protein ACGFX2_37730 [Streptomyces goshikiensis]|uniref:hypothetical protein n=1 Tax=Streptomyces goshikiensis TaxID=1942 RepID=UPI003723CBF9